MFRLLPTCVAIIVVLTGILSDVRASSGWAELRQGLSGAETAEKIGRPLLGTRSRGLEVWTYDHRGEVVLKDGSLLFWSAPLSEGAAKTERERPEARVVRAGPKSVYRPTATVPVERSMRPRTRAAIVISSYRF